MAALDDVVNLYRRPGDPEALIDLFCETKRLVLVDRRPPEVYWEGALIEADWEDKVRLWELLWTLALHAGNSVDRTMLSSSDSDRAIATRKSRLSYMIPPELDALIEDVRPRSYRLDLRTGDIALLQLESDECLVEVLPASDASC